MPDLLRIVAFLVVSLVWTSNAYSQSGPSELARLAAERLEAAQAGLNAAQSARNRVDALTRTIRAYEEGLEALRQGLRQAALREAAIENELAAARGELSKLLGVLMSIKSAQGPIGLIHPAGPLGAAQSGMIVGEVTPAIKARADKLSATLDELVLIRSLQESAADQLQVGLTGAQSARAALSKAISERVDLPMRFDADPAAMALLEDNAVTLQDFATGLIEMDVGGEVIDPVVDFASAKGTLPLPTEGQVLRKFGEKDAAGIARPGLIMAVPARALVTAPWAATLRFAGPLLDYGNVIIIEPEAGVLLILAGVQEHYGQVGQVLTPGAPLGIMGGDGPDVGTFLSNAANTSGSELTETLYIELRDGKEPIDPSDWFAETKEETQ